MTAIGAENTLADPIDCDRHYDQTKEKQTGEQTNLFANNILKN